MHREKERYCLTILQILGNGPEAFWSLQFQLGWFGNSPLQWKIELTLFFLVEMDYLRKVWPHLSIVLQHWSNLECMLTSSQSWQKSSSTWKGVDEPWKWIKSTLLSPPHGYHPVMNNTGQLITMILLLPVYNDYYDNLLFLFCMSHTKSSFLSVWYEKKAWIHKYNVLREYNVYCTAAQKFSNHKL